jgi:DNA-binding beta-propeller fold protein YncE
VFARLANGNAARNGAIEGQRTLLGRTMHGIDYDEIHDEIVVPQQFGQAILVFKGSARGEEAPIRVIQGPQTMLTAMDRLAVDQHNNEIFVPEGDRILVFDRTANGNVAPKRILGPSPGFTEAATLAIDSGAAMPKRVITGVRARLGDPGNMRVYPEGGLIFVAQQAGYIGVWGIDDNGDIPPRFTVGGPQGMLKKPRGLDIDPVHNAVIVSDKELNAVLTYEMPQIFKPRSSADQK